MTRLDIIVAYKVLQVLRNRRPHIHRKRQLEKYVQKDVMSYLHARLGITFFTDEIRLKPIECPIERLSLA